MLYLDLSESHVSPDFSAVQALPPGTTVDKYRLHEAVSEDGCGIVYRAEDLELNCQVAVKEHLPRRIASRVGLREVKPRDDALAAEFQASVQAFSENAALLASLRIPSIVSVSHEWQEGGTAYRAMPWLEGETLASRLAARSIPSGHLLQQKVLEPLLDAVSALHVRRYVHRRISTETVFFTSDSRLILFGFSMVPGSVDSRLGAPDAFTSIELTEALGHRIGTRPIGPWSDIYSIGALMHLIVRGALPSPASSRLVKENYSLLGSMAELGISVDLLRAIDWALTVLPEKRPRDIAQFRKRFRGEKRNAAPVARQRRTPLQTPAAEQRPPEPAGGTAPRKVSSPSNLNAVRGEPSEFLSTRPMVYGERPVATPAGVSANAQASAPAPAAHAATAPAAAPAAQTDPEPNPEPAATPLHATEPHATADTAASRSASASAPKPMAPPPAAPAQESSRRSTRRGLWIAGATIAASLAFVAITGWWLLGAWRLPSSGPTASVVPVPPFATATAATLPSSAKPLAPPASAVAAAPAASAAPKVDVAAAPTAEPSATEEVTSPPFDLPQLRAPAAPPASSTAAASPSTPIRVSSPGRPKSEQLSAQHEGAPVNSPGRPKSEQLSAQHEGAPVNSAGRPKSEHRSAQHEGAPTNSPGHPGPALIPPRKATDRRCSDLLARQSLGDTIASRHSLNQKCQ
jgi:serine/threonine protein kinase